MVVEVTEDVPLREDYYWLTLEQVHDLLKVETLINMYARTVLSCVPVDRPAGVAAADSFTAALLRSYDPALPAVHQQSEILSWFSERKAQCDWHARRVPLADIEGWKWGSHELSGGDEAAFRIVGVRVKAVTREVTSWTQPLLEPTGHGLAAFVAKPIDGVLHLLVQARHEPGLKNIVEMAPTVQLPMVAGSGPAPFADLVRSAPAHRRRFDTLLSEEGGRFLNGLTRYQVIEVGEEFPERVPPEFCWMTVQQVMRLLEHSHYLNIEARTLLACVHSLW